MTRFFEPINISATHIYHSALELSPLSSIIRRLYYRQRHIPFPRVVAGTPDIWIEQTHLTSEATHTYTWSPCGQFIAIKTPKSVEIRHPLSSELLTTLTKSDVSLPGELAYSPDGHSLASISGASLIVWDIQTGGVAKKIECGGINNILLVWSLDGSEICTIDDSYGVHVYYVASGTTFSPGILQSSDKPQLWAYDTSFWAMTTGFNNQVLTIKISKIGPILTKIESFHIKSWGTCNGIGTFSPATYRVFVSVSSGLHILDVQNSECLLEIKGNYSVSNPHCFSPDGGLFAISSFEGLHIWEYVSSHYTLWRRFPHSPGFFRSSPLQFSPTLSLILGSPTGVPKVWHLDDPLTATCSDSCTLLAVLSCCGTYTAISYRGNSVVTITNLHSQTPPQFIDTDMEIDLLVLTGNILLVWDEPKVVAWQLTEEGVVNGVFGGRRANCSDGIWTAVVTDHSKLSVEDQIVIIKDEENITHVYHTRTGEILKPAHVSPQSHNRQYSLWEMSYCHHYLHYYDLFGPNILPGGSWEISPATLQKGWIESPEGEHRLWIPTEWTASLLSSGWLHTITALWLHLEGKTVVIVF